MEYIVVHKTIKLWNIYKPINGLKRGPVYKTINKLKMINLARKTAYDAALSLFCVAIVE